MAEPNTLGLYPHATLNGVPLPFDVLLSVALVKLAFSASVSAAVTIPAGGDLLIIYADPTVSSYLFLDGVAAVPADAIVTDDMHYIAAGTVKSIDPNGATTFTVIGGAAGTVHIEFARRWRDAKNRQQFERT